MSEAAKKHLEYLLELDQLNLNGLIDRARALPDFPPELKSALYEAHHAIKKEIQRREQGGDPDDYGGWTPTVHKAGDPVAGVVCNMLGHKWRDYGPGEATKNCARCKRQESLTRTDRAWARSRQKYGF